MQNLFGQLDEVDSREEWRSFAAEEVSHCSPSSRCRASASSTRSTANTSAPSTPTRRDDADRHDIEKILDPRNWTISCNSSARQAQTAVHQPGWSRILEKIGPEPEKWRLTTALIFFYGRDAEAVSSSLRPRPAPRKRLGLVEVDKGYIWITPLKDRPSKKGVRIRTSKQERVQGLSPTARLRSVACWGGAPPPTSFSPVPPR